MKVGESKDFGTFIREYRVKSDAEIEDDFRFAMYQLNPARPIIARAEYAYEELPPIELKERNQP